MTKKIAVELVDESEDSSDKLLDHVKNTRQDVIYRTPKFKGGKKWLTVIKTTDKDGSPFFHVQRLGKDSVAFICYAEHRRGELLCLKQWSAPYKGMITGAFTGSLDKDGKSIEDIVIEELREEAGITATSDRLKLVSRDRVGTSTDETCYLYLINISNLPIEQKEPENVYEQLAQRLWLTCSEIQEHGDWRAKLLCLWYHDNVLNDHENLTRQITSAVEPRGKAIAWKTAKDRKSVMQELDRVGFLFQVDYYMDIVPDPQGFKFALKFPDAADYALARERVFSKLSKYTPSKVVHNHYGRSASPITADAASKYLPSCLLRTSYNSIDGGFNSSDGARHFRNWLNQIASPVASGEVPFKLAKAHADGLFTVRNAAGEQFEPLGIMTAAQWSDAVQKILSPVPVATSIEAKPEEPLKSQRDYCPDKQCWATKEAAQAYLMKLAQVLERDHGVVAAIRRMSVQQGAAANEFYLVNTRTGTIIKKSELIDA